jgi:hypothetical protein
MNILKLTHKQLLADYLVCPILQHINCLENSKLIPTHAHGHTHMHTLKLHGTKQMINTDHIIHLHKKM